MPYFDTVFPGSTVPSGFRITDPGGIVAQNLEGNLVTLETLDRSFRTRAPKSGTSTIVPTNIAEPYTWFTSLQEMRRRNALKGAFDSSVFHEDNGHPWLHSQKSLTGKMWDFSYIHPYGGSEHRYWGAYPENINGISTGFLVPESGLESWAALMYGRMAPTGSSFSFAAFSGELREGLPRLLPSSTKSMVGALKGMGDDYLNVKFGWEPLLDDLRALALSLLEASYGLYRPFGAVRRNRDEKPVTTRDESSALNYQMPVLTAVSGNIPWLRSDAQLKRTETKHRWIEGEFVYIPKAGFDPSKYMDRLETLMSLDITPAVLWQLSPWSWLVDWFVDIGGALQSAEAATSNRVLSTFCYAMEETKTKVSVSLRNIHGSGGAQYMGPPDMSLTWHYTRKRRIRANPFGYTGSSSSALQGDQMAILAALGLSRASR